MTADQNQRPSPGRVAASLLLWAVASAVAFAGLVFVIGAILAPTMYSR